MSQATDLDEKTELERIRLYDLSARQRIRRLDVLLDEQMRILKLDPALRSGTFSNRAAGRRTIGMLGIRIFAAAFSVASLTAFYAGYWYAHWR